MFQEEEIIKMMTCAFLRGRSSDLVQLLFYYIVLDQVLFYYAKTKLDAIYFFRHEHFYMSRRHQCLMYKMLHIIGCN